jgi:hypothetical protein
MDANHDRFRLHKYSSQDGMQGHVPGQSVRLSRQTICPTAETVRAQVVVFFRANHREIRTRGSGQLIAVPISGASARVENEHDRETSQIVA